MNYQKTVYLLFSTDIVHSGHLSILKKAVELGNLTVGILSDSAVATYKRYPLLPYAERAALLSNFKGVERVVCQETLSYRGIIERLHPDIIVHGDDWCRGVLKPLRDEVVELLSAYGGKLVEFPYTENAALRDIENRNMDGAAVPDIRRGLLKKLLDTKGFVRIMEAHSGLSSLIVDNAAIYQDGAVRAFDGVWMSSHCDSTMKCKPDIESVDMTGRIQIINEIMDKTAKPLILECDIGGLSGGFVHYICTLESMGVSAVVIEDKADLKKNFLFVAEAKQTQDSTEHFCAEISTGKQALHTKDFMLIARVDSLILEKGIDEALSHAFAYLKAGADGIMIHSRKKEPDEIFEFAEKFRKQDLTTPLAVVPDSLNSVTEEEFQKHGVNIVIYENHLIRSALPAMMETAKCILENHCAKEAEDKLSPIKDVITLIPEKTYAYPGRGGITCDSKPQITGYLSGTFDLFHIGHLNLLRRAKSFCDRLIVGVHESGARKGKATFIPLEERMKIVAACRYVDEVIPAPAEDSDVWKSHHFQRLFVGSDYLGSERFQRYTEYFEDKGVEIVYFPYTIGTSSTQLRKSLLEKE